MDDIEEFRYEILENGKWIKRCSTTVGYAENRDMKDYLLEGLNNDWVRNAHSKNIGKDI